MSTDEGKTKEYWAMGISDLEDFNYLTRTVKVININ